MAECEPGVGTQPIDTQLHVCWIVFRRHFVCACVCLGKGGGESIRWEKQHFGSRLAFLSDVENWDSCTVRPGGILD